MSSIDTFTEFLRAAVTPVALISGIGLILLSCTNRLGRTIDRTRQLINDLDNTDTKRRDIKINEINILYKRSRYLRNSILTIVISIITSCLIIPVLFVMYLFAIDIRFIGYILFILSIIAILISSVYFIKDIVLTLKALKLEAKDYLMQENS